MSEWTICVTPMPTEEALDLARRIADAEDPDCDDLLFADGPEVCAALRGEVLRLREVIEQVRVELVDAQRPDLALNALAKAGVW